MELLVITRNMAAGGAERVISELLNAWAVTDCKCTLLLIEKKEVFYSISKKVEIVEIENRSSHQYIDKYRKYIEVRKIIRNRKPDIILTMPEEIGIYVGLFTRGLNVPVVVSERNNPWIMPNKLITRTLRKMVYPFLDGFIFQTEEAASFFSKHIQNKGIVLDNPLNIEKLPKAWIGKREKIIVSVGRLEKQKNYKVLIAAFQKVYEKHPDYKLIIYGEGSQRNELENYAKEVLKTGSFNFPGKRKDVLEVINRATCFALCSDYEGVPNALIEALAIGIPCVSTDCAPGGARHLIQNGKNGFIVPVGDSSALANKINMIIDNPLLLNEFSENGLMIRERMDVEKVSENWMEYLKLVIEKSRR